MQIFLIFGIGFAIAAVTFALQNNTPVAVSFAIWRFEGSLAIVLLLAVGLGALIAGLVSSPAMIRAQWAGGRLRRELADLQSDKATLEKKVESLNVEVAKISAARSPTVAATTTPAPAQGAPG